jgi:hypothetical protein
MSQKRRQPSSPDVDTGHATGPTSGPTSIQGAEASEIPGERGSVDTDPRRINARKTPAQTGENSTGDVGLRGTPDIADGADHGHRKHN